MPAAAAWRDVARSRYQVREYLGESLMGRPDTPYHWTEDEFSGDVAEGGPVPPLTTDNGYVTKDSGQREEFSTGSKRDTREGKGRYDLVPPESLARLAGVYERGAKKYSANNWRLGQPQSRFMDSAIRHLFNYLGGDRSEDHLGQCAFNVFALMSQEERLKAGTLPAELNDLPEAKP